MALNAINDAVRTVMADAISDAIDAGSAGGTFELYTASFSVLLAIMTFSVTSSPGASAGVATYSAITSEASAIATGTAAVLRISSSNAADTPLTKIHDGTVGTSGADYNMNTVAVTIGDTVACSSYVITQPAS